MIINEGSEVGSFIDEGQDSNFGMKKCVYCPPVVHESTVSVSKIVLKFGCVFIDIDVSLLSL